MRYDCGGETGGEVVTTIQTIIEHAARIFEVHPDAITSPGHKRPARDARQAVCYVAVRQGHRPKEISAVINRSKNVALESEWRARELMEVDAGFLRNVSALWSACVK